MAPFPTRLGLVAAMLLGSGAATSARAAAPASRPAVAVPPAAEAPPTTRPSWPAVPRGELARIYATELGDRFAPDRIDRLYAVHELVERYFEAGTSADRKKAVAAITAAEPDPVVVGRLCRVRMYWPALAPGGVYYVNEKVGVFPVRYFFGLPKAYDRAVPWPVVLKLPTADAFVANPPPSAEQVAGIYQRWVQEEQAAHPDAVVVMPLLNLDELWGPGHAGMNAALMPLRHVADRANVDPARVYLVGHDMSAFAAWNLALHYPTYFAAFNPLAGGASLPWQRLRVGMLRNVLPVVWHDADDQVVKVGIARGTVQALRLQKVPVEYEETKTVGHVPDAGTAERAYAKMRSRTRDLYPATVTIQSNRPDTAFNRADWAQVYQPIDPGEEHKSGLRHGSGVLTFQDNPVRLDAAIKGQKIDVSAGNVDSFRLYLNDRMLDLTKPVTVTVNGKPKFAGTVPQSVAELLADQLFLGRGWRYYTAVIDVEMTPRTLAATRSSTVPATSPTTAQTR